MRAFCFISLLFMLGSHLPAQSSVQPTSTERPLDLVEMRKQLQVQEKTVLELTKSVNSVEIDLSQNNKKYLKLAAERAFLEEKITTAKKNADFDSENLKKTYSQTKNLLMGVLLNKLENTQNSSDLLSRKILIENLQKRLADLEGVMKINQTIQAEIDGLYAQLQESINTENELVSVMNELEQRKNELRNNLELETQKKVAVQSQFNDVKNRQAIERQNKRKEKLKETYSKMQITEEIKIPSQAVNSAGKGGDYSLPLEHFTGLEYKEKGITFKFQGKMDVKATRAGKIVYTGALANYGNVIMIDHGSDTRSVLFGQFDYTVKNGDQVALGQVVGTTSPKSNNALQSGSFYFEVRKNNLAQNTYLLLDKKALSK